MVLYEYAYDEKGSLIHISSITKENRLDNNYYCISCHEPMRPRLGDKNAHHFYHPNTSCSFESYIHKLGKELFYREYKKCLDEGTPFNVDIPQKTICSEAESCRFHKGECELGNQVNTYDLTEFFKIISIPETPDGDFIPDIYLESSKGEKLYIEIFCTSKCSDKKTTSGKRIIEIKAENISNIPCNYHGTKEKVQAIDANYFQEILNHHISGDNSTLYNFKGKEKVPDGECPIRVKGLILYQSGKCYIHEYSAIEYLQRKINKQNEVYCEAAVLDNAAFFIKEDDEYAALCLANAYKNHGLKISPCKLCKHCKVYQDNTQSNLRYYCAADDNLRYNKKLYRYCRLQEFDADEMKVYRYLNYRRNRAITLVQGM